MICVNKRSTPPAVLQVREAAAAKILRDAFTLGTTHFERKDFDSDIYGHDDVKAALRDDQQRKCAFCESRFDHVAFGDVEHFRPKAAYRRREKDKLRRPGYYWLAYDWANLFYSCQLCNQQFKRNLFPLAVERDRARSHNDDVKKEKPLLINPATQDPSLFLGFRKEYAFAVKGCREGRSTIKTLGLNRDALGEKRRERLADLVRHRELCELLRARLGIKPSPALQARHSHHEATLAEATQNQSEYTAMARAFLANR